MDAQDLAEGDLADFGIGLSEAGDWQQGAEDFGGMV